MARGEPIPGIGKRQPRRSSAAAPGTTAIANAKSQDEKWAEAYALAEKQLKEEDEEGFDVGALAETLGELAGPDLHTAALSVCPLLAHTTLLPHPLPLPSFYTHINPGSGPGPGTEPVPDRSRSRHRCW